MNKIYSLLIISFCLPGINNAQFDAALYGLTSVAQSGLYNPATKSDMRLSIGLAQTGTSAYSTGFSAFEALASGSNFSENLDNLILQVNNRDVIHVKNDINVLYTAFNLNTRMQLSFGLRVNNTAYTQIPVNVMRLLRGNNQEDLLNKEVNFGGFGFEVSQIPAIHAGLQYQINDRLSIGGRLHYLSGFFHYQLRTQDNNILAYLGEDEWRLDSDVSIRSSQVFEQMDGRQRQIAYFRNNGYQLDIGTEYKFNDNLTISGSLLGLGSVNYSQNVESISSKGQFTYDGIDLNDNDFQINTSAIIDSLIQSLEFESIEGQSYTRALPLTAFLAATYRWTEKHQFSLINSYNKWGELSYINSSIRYLWSPFTYLHTMINLNTINAEIWGLGAGFQARVNGAQFFLMADFMQPNFSLSKVRGISLNIGLNMVLFPRTIKS